MEITEMISFFEEIFVCFFLCFLKSHKLEGPLPSHLSGEISCTFIILKAFHLPIKLSLCLKRCLMSSSSLTLIPITITDTTRSGKHLQFLMCCCKFIKQEDEIYGERKTMQFKDIENLSPNCCVKCANLLIILTVQVMFKKKNGISDNLHEVHEQNRLPQDIFCSKSYRLFPTPFYLA